RQWARESPGGRSMKFLVERSVHKTGGAEQDVYLLTSEDDTRQAEVWPAAGCNCLRWRVSGPAGPLEVLYAAADWETNPVPTRSGIPILFPFPNRIRDGRFSWAGREYQLPGNDPIKKNAIHGFACRRPWRVKNSNAKDDLATLTAEFRAS